MAASLDSAVLDQLNSKEARELHTICNNLRSYGVNKFVQLPDIIVVGQQSSGKSSVLEAITHLRFPVESGLCTRFPTELILRHSKTPSVSVSIQYEDKSKEPHIFERTDFKSEDLPEIIDKAKPFMGILPGSPKSIEFSRDILRLEVEGPQLQPLTLIDLPGLYATGTATQSVQGKDFVNDLVLDYMKKENSIMLVVVDAVTQLANQVALQAAKDLDKTRQRTIGVITKPDRIVPGSEEEADWVQVAKNEETANILTRGWHVLRNRSEKHTSLEQRDEEESIFFQSGAWSAVPQANLGVTNLRKKLGGIMFDHLSKGLPKVSSSIDDSLKDVGEKLKRLGDPRPTTAAKRTFLTAIAEEYHRLASDGINGWYRHPFFGDLDDDERKLRAHLRNFNLALEYTMRTKGCSRSIGEIHDYKSSELDSFLSTHPYDFPRPRVITLQTASEEVQVKAAKNRGLEFPRMLNQDLIVGLFREMSKPWKEIADFHVNAVRTEVQKFVQAILGQVVTSQEVIAGIMSHLVEPFFAKKASTLEAKVTELLSPYTEGVAVPLDLNVHMRSTAIQEAFHGPFLDYFRGEVSKKELHVSQSERQRDTEFYADAFLNMFSENKTDLSVYETIIMVHAYYNRACDTFTDNVINLAVERCLVSQIPKILTASVVLELSNETLQLIAAEPPETQKLREELERNKKILMEGSIQCFGLRWRRRDAVSQS